MINVENDDIELVFINNVNTKLMFVFIYINICPRMLRRGGVSGPKGRSWPAYPPSKPWFVLFLISLELSADPVT